MTKPQRHSRRRLLQGAAFALGAAAASRAMPPAAAEGEIKDEDKVKKSEAQYQPHPKGQQRCEICLQFEPPGTCKIVQGPISPKGWCQYFAARENAR